MGVFVMLFNKYKLYGIIFGILLFIIAVFVNNTTFTIICGSIIIVWLFGLIPFALIQRNLDDKAEREYQKQLEERESKIDKAIDKILNDKEN